MGFARLPQLARSPSDSVLYGLMFTAISIARGLVPSAAHNRPHASPHDPIFGTVRHTVSEVTLSAPCGCPRAARRFATRGHPPLRLLPAEGPDGEPSVRPLPARAAPRLPPALATSPRPVRRLSAAGAPTCALPLAAEAYPSSAAWQEQPHRPAEAGRAHVHVQEELPQHHGDPQLPVPAHWQRVRERLRLLVELSE